jgi:hypothetical protein
MMEIFPNDFDESLRAKMGGSGSGRRWGSKETTGGYPQVDVRSWQRDGYLAAGRWFVCDDLKIGVAATLDGHGNPIRAILSHQHRKDFVIWFSWTRCNYGGARAWFLCPTRGCGRRVAILYGDASLACRHCRQLSYGTQQESPRFRALRRAQAIRMKLRGSPSLADPFPDRPPGMHRRTYRRLYSESLQREGAFMGGVISFLNLRQTFQRGNG